MKKILLILLCLPLFLFSQEERKYERTMSVYQFAKELKDAADRGFTKYVAIIEGFIGWFLLSIFLVSILNQMMSV